MKESTFVSQSPKTAYKTEILHDVPADQVESTVDERTKRPGYRTHVILPEGNNEFTLIFIYDA
jgi:hypothetical protein